MIEIIKNMKNEPRSLQTFRLDPLSDGRFNTYSNKIGLSELREKLLKEQGYICCYCMSRINISNSSEIEKTKIEHYQPRDNSREIEVHYNNLYLACDGRKQCNTYDKKKLDTYKNCRCKYKREQAFLQHCDTCKDDRELNYIKLDKITQNKIKYKSSGIIYSEDKNIDCELNHVLNLNTIRLVANRKQVKLILWNHLPKENNWSKPKIKSIIYKYEHSVKKPPYIGYLLYLLNKKIR